MEEELLSCKSVSKVMIASAFLSREGVQVLQKIKEQYSLKKECIILYISEQFSADKPYEILNQLSDLCITKILFDHNFHPKVYLIQGEPNKFIFGSSNLTEGGMTNNIEFNYIGSPSQDEINDITAFFDYCDNKAKVVDAEVIRYYKDKQTDIEQLYKAQKKLTTALTGFTHQDDAFSPDDYDIDDYFFNFGDYETFFARNQKKGGTDIKAKRERVQRKMLEIHQQVYPNIRKLGIAHHKRKENITSLIIPHPINQFSVAWLGVRYGKTPPEIDVLNIYKDKDDDIYGFQKHGCLQFSISSNGFEINLFLAVRHEAIDRDYLHENLEKLKPRIEIELKKLRGLGFEWVIWDNDKDEPIIFDVDSEDLSTFCDFFRKNDKDGRESYLRKFYEPDNNILKTKESIAAEIIRIMKILLPLYNTMVWRPKV